MKQLLESLGVWGNAAAFLGAAALILALGSKLERWADRIGALTKLGHLFAGTILLAVASSLPEIATTITACLHGKTDIAVNNLLGGVIMQTMVLAFADVVGRRKALTGTVPSYGLLIQGVGLMVMLALTSIIAGVETHFRDVGWFSRVAPFALVALYVFVQRATMGRKSPPPWKPSVASEQEDSEQQAEVDEDGEQHSLARLCTMFGIASAIICFAGYLVVVTTENIAASTGASQSFLGFTIVAFATSLPEISTTLSANRRGHGITAVSNIFGSNSFDVSLLALVAAMSSGPLFADALIPSVFAASLGIILTALYLGGMLERRDRTILRMGWDSAAVVVLGTLGIWMMFELGAH